MCGNFRHKSAVALYIPCTYKYLSIQRTCAVLCLLKVATWCQSRGSLSVQESSALLNYDIPITRSPKSLSWQENVINFYYYLILSPTCKSLLDVNADRSMV
jgi:hypothetical protein